MKYQTINKLLPLFLLPFLLSCNFSSRGQQQSVNAKTNKTYGSLRAAGNMSEPRAAHTATLLNDGRVLMVGGMERNQVFSNTAEIYDPQRNGVTKSKALMTITRVSHSATLLPDGKVLIAGGWEARQTTNKAEIYDPIADTFTALPAMNAVRASHTATLLNNGTVLIAGGYDGKQQLGSCEIFDPVTQKFQIIGELIEPRSGHTASLLLDGKLLLAGGHSNQKMPLQSAEIFDPITNKISQTGPMKVIRYKHASVTLNDGRVMVIGGSDQRDGGGQYASTEIFDPATRTFVAGPALNKARFKITDSVAKLNDGKVLVAGGDPQMEVLDPTANQFFIVQGETGKALHFASATALPNGRVLMAGGYAFGSAATGPTSTSMMWVFEDK